MFGSSTSAIFYTLYNCYPDWIALLVDFEYACHTEVYKQSIKCNSGHKNIHVNLQKRFCMHDQKNACILNMG